MSNILSGGNTLSLNVPNGARLAVSALSGTYSATVTAGVNRGTVLATNSAVDQTFGPYPSGAVIALSASLGGSVDFDIDVTPVLMAGENPVFIVSSTAPVNGDGRPNGTIYIQTA
jgi:hypothetical protein